MGQQHSVAWSAQVPGVLISEGRHITRIKVIFDQ